MVCLPLSFYLIFPSLSRCSPVKFLNFHTSDIIWSLFFPELFHLHNTVRLHLKKKLMFIFILRERERELERERGREKRRHRIRSSPQALSCQHRARCGGQTHKAWDHDLSPSPTLNWLSHPRAPTIELSTEEFPKFQALLLLGHVLLFGIDFQQLFFLPVEAL